jgi:orotate phosphoribosyltransferase
VVHVRRAAIGDVREIIRLALEIQDVHVDGRPDLFKPGGVEGPGQVAARLQSPDHLYWVAMLGSEIVGYAYARVAHEAESLWRHAARILVLDQMGVGARHRSHGVGARLWESVREAAVAHDADRVILNVWSFNRGARRFYERMGFRSFHERMAFELGASSPAAAAPAAAAPAAAPPPGPDSPNDFLGVVPGARGHFVFESGHHSDRWLDLDALFADASVIGPWVAKLAERLARYDIAAVCGPLTGGAFLAQLVAARLGVPFAFTDRAVPPNADRMFGVEYPLRPSLARVVEGRRVAIVDDVVSAGSASRGTYASLAAAGATPVVVGALLVIGDAARRHFGDIGVAVEAVSGTDGTLWRPADCPLCRAGVPLVDRTG